MLTLPPRHFNWRIRGNPLSWLAEQAGVLNAPHDLVIATSTVDVATLRGLVPGLAATPTAVYFHENQFAYPQSEDQRKHTRLEPQMVNLYAALAADELWFNSGHNRESFIAGVKSLVAALPDHVPDAEWLDLLADKSYRLPVPLEPVTPANTASSSTLRLVWNHRWEYDKGLEQLSAAVTALCEHGVALKLTLLGQRFRRVPPVMQALLERLRHGGESVELEFNDYVSDRSDYLNLLSKQDIVLSTAQHDFQGLSIMEAVQAGCRPLLPRRLCYPEFFTEDYLYASHPDTLDKEAMSLVQRLQYWVKEPASMPPLPNLASLEWPHLRAMYRQRIEGLAR